MKLTKQQKQEKSKDLAKVLKDVSHLFFTEYRGLKFQEMGELRAKLKPMKCRYNVVKNSLLSHALKRAGIKVRGDFSLGGPTALLLVPEDDPVSPVRALAAFAKENENLKIKAGYVDGGWLTPEQCKQLSALGTKPELLGKLASSLYSSVAQVAWVVTAPMQELAMTLKALKEKKKAEGKGK